MRMRPLARKVPNGMFNPDELMVSRRGPVLHKNLYVFHITQPGKSGGAAPDAPTRLSRSSHKPGFDPPGFPAARLYLL